MYEQPIQPGETWFFARLRRHLGELARLAAPTIVSRLGVLMIVQVDAVMVGHAGTAELAALNLGNAVTTNLIVLGMGLLMGTLVLSANAFGAGDHRECGAVWRRALPYALCIGLVGFACAFQGQTLMALLGQKGDLASGSGAVVRIMAFGIPPVLLFLATNFFLESLRRPVPGMVLMLLANLVNVALNWLFIYGIGPLPAMGAEGAALATTIVRYGVCAGAIAYVWWLLPDRDAFGVRQAPPRDAEAERRQRRIGYATGFGIGAESVSFTAMVMFAGWLGELSAAAYGIAFNLLALFFMAAIGVGSATSVRVGIAYGRRDHPDLVLAGWTGLGANTVLALLFAVLIFTQADGLAALYTGDPALRAVAAGLVSLVAVVLVLDGGQAVMAQALRGRRDVWVPMAFQTVSYLAVMLPLGWIWAFRWGAGVDGLMLTVLAASLLSLTLQASRFAWLARRPL